MMVKESIKNAKERRPESPTSSDAGEGESSDYDRDFEAFDMRSNKLISYVITVHACECLGLLKL